MMFWYALAFFWVANAADWYTTKRLVMDRKVAREVNPVVNYVMNKSPLSDEYDLLFIKILFGALISIFGSAQLLWVLGGLFALVALSNKYFLLSKLLRWWRSR